MNRCTIILTLFALALSASAQSLTNISGRVYERVEIRNVRPDGIEIRHAKGLAFLSFKELPHEVRSAHNYNPSAAADYQRQLEAQRRAARELHRSQAQSQARLQSVASVESLGLDATLTVISVNADGYLATGHAVVTHEHQVADRPAPERGNKSALQPAPRVFTVARPVSQSLGDAVFIHAPNAPVVDGETVTARIYLCGRYQYVNVLGGQRTVHAYALDPAAAIRIYTAATQ
jgi:hypothetical protein